MVEGAYDGMKLNCTDQAILSDSKLGNDKGYVVPLEIMPSGQFEPLYKTTLSVQVYSILLNNAAQVSIIITVSDIQISL